MNRRPPIEPMIYHNEALMNELNEFCIALKIWLFPIPEELSDKLPGLQRRYPKPDLSEIDNLQARINEQLRKDAEPMRRY